MDTQRESRLFDLMLAGAVTIAVPLLAFIVWPLISERMASAPQGAILTYEVDPDSLPKGTTVDMELLTQAINKRVNLKSRKIAHVRQTEDQRIEIAMIRQDEAEQRIAEQSLANSATLEFRILANRRRDKAVIDRAMADPSKTRVFDSEGYVLAWWTPVKAGAEETLSDLPEIACRTRKQGKREITDVLVMKDDLDLTGVYLIKAEASAGPRGQPELSLNFTRKGGQLFRQLTGSHLPDKTTNVDCNLGVIIKGELYAAPMIVSTIYNHAEIGVPCTKQELGDLVDLLNAGSLPAKIRLVGTKQSP